ncbi:M20/M25/M40 family metallo-hydrolase [Acinetobacter shaoyimingii]|uniref:M20/M25/M40 family metallo-hydrolase n=2 Tax=Acinetobacter shaoyimingii TaxID=2715164 RepID=A0A6G8RUC8_9GAMM|nr:M20/M25/M40 family metallo-hydrolase [Acinetobacter shaoyimingii]QIO05542.1 M20/M25/M40 family metallo-hydrolase [Acinetobacter shaoyimingii]
MKHKFKVLMFSSVLALYACDRKNDTSEHSSASKNPTIQFNADHMMKHLEQFQDIAQQHGGNRAVGTEGGKASANYILEQAQKSGFTVKTYAFQNREKTVGQNIIVEIPGQSEDKIVLMGAHYDSVKSGPGINDNASGVAVLIELMNQIHQNKIQPKHTLHLAFWDSEEVGIAGSQDYVKNLKSEQLKKIKAYINLDMVGTKNPDILIADGDHSSVDEMEKMLKERGMKEADYKTLTDGLRGLPTHAGDLALENHLKDFFKQKNLKIKEDLSILTASDTAPFLGKVPVSSIILFKEEMKGNELYFAPCYHQACDTIDLVDPKSLKLAGEALNDLLGHIE